MNRSMPASRFVALAAIFGLVLFALAGTVFAQTETGQVSGVVTDSSGAVVQGAKVTVTKIDTNFARTEVTSASGEFAITNLQPGGYLVAVTASGFSDFKQKVEVVVGSRTTLEPHLAVGSASTTVEVSGEIAAVQVDTQTQTLGQTISPDQIIGLPSLTRNIYDFVATAGNVSDGDPNAGRGAMGIAINGQRAASTNILLDGAENVDFFTASVGQQVPLDSVQEFKVSTSNFTSEYGRASGGVVNVATKSGTNQFHGSLYEYNRVSALASQTYQTDAINASQRAQGLATIPNSTFVRNQFGYSIGGPVIKNKLFFFSNTEWTRVRSSANNQSYVFTPQFIAQTAPATQSFWSTYGTLASGVSSVGAPITASQLAAGVPGWPNAGAGSPNFTALAGSNPNLPVLQLVNFTVPTDAGAGAPENTYSTVNRADFNITDKTTLWVRYALYNELDFPGFVGFSPYAGYDTGQTNRDHNAVINLTHVFIPTVVNQLKLSYNRLDNLQPLGQQPVSPSLYLAGTVPVIGNNPIYLPGYLPNTQGNAIPFGGPQNLYEFTDQVSWTKGKHGLSFGGTFIQARDNRVFGAYEEGIADLARRNSGSLDAMLGGTIYSYQVALNPAGLFPCQTDITTDLLINPASCTLNLPAGEPDFERNNRFNDGSLYGQDAWKVTKRLVLNLGLRWEYFGVQHNSDPKLDSNFYYTGALTPASIRAGFVSPAPSSPLHQLWKSSPRNFGPRIGFAYDVFGDGKTSIRGGYGISYERNFGNVTFNIIQNPPNYAVLQLAGQFPLPTANLGPFAGSGTKVLPAVTLRAVDPNIKTAYAEGYSLAAEREVVRNTVVAVEYSGSRGIHQYSITNVNRFYGGPTYNGDPNIDPPYVSGNAIPPGGGFEAGRTNNQFGNINFRGSNGDSWYNGVNFRLQSSNFQSKGLMFALNFTWAHSLDDLSSTFSETNSGGAQGSLGFLDWQHPELDKASSDYDVRKRLGFSAVYTPTQLHFGNRVTDTVLGGWSIAPIWTWHTGAPFTMYDCGFAFTICARQLNGAQGTYAPITAQDPINAPNTFSYFSPATYVPYVATVNGQIVSPSVAGGVADVPSCTNGVCAFPSNMVRRNTFRVPNTYNVNLGVYKTFKITERVQAQLRGEAYNLFNHSNYYLNYGTTDSEFQNPALPLITVSKGTNPGGVPERRNLQLALRLTF